jgi:hypothetical protein
MNHRCIWTIISYNWSIGKTGEFKVASNECANNTKVAFENTYPGENVMAIFKGTSPSCLTYPLRWKDIREHV